MPDETGWLLEKQDKGDNWFIGVINGLLGWTTDPNKALRLARRGDAEAIATICEDAERISEHLWPDMEVGSESAPQDTASPFNSGMSGYIRAKAPEADQRTEREEKKS